MSVKPPDADEVSLARPDPGVAGKSASARSAFATGSPAAFSFSKIAAGDACPSSRVRDGGVAVSSSSPSGGRADETSRASLAARLAAFAARRSASRASAVWRFSSSLPTGSSADRHVFGSSSCQTSGPNCPMCCPSKLHRCAAASSPPDAKKSLGVSSPNASTRKNSSACTQVRLSCACQYPRHSTSFRQISVFRVGSVLSSRRPRDARCISSTALFTSHRRTRPTESPVTSLDPSGSIATDTMLSPGLCPAKKSHASLPSFTSHARTCPSACPTNRNVCGRPVPRCSRSPRRVASHAAHSAARSAVGSWSEPLASASTSPDTSRSGGSGGGSSFARRSPMSDHTKTFPAKSPVARTVDSSLHTQNRMSDWCPRTTRRGVSIDASCESSHSVISRDHPAAAKRTSG